MLSSPIVETSIHNYSIMPVKAAGASLSHFTHQCMKSKFDDNFVNSGGADSTRTCSRVIGVLLVCYIGALVIWRKKSAVRSGSGFADSILVQSRIRRARTIIRIKEM